MAKTFPEKAARLIDVADPGTGDKLQAFASRKVCGVIGLGRGYRHPTVTPGLQYLPFQKARIKCAIK